MILKTKRPTRRLVLAALKGLEITEVLVQSEMVEVPSRDGIYKAHEATGRRFVSIVAEA